jgi:hypothetical protein
MESMYEQLALSHQDALRIIETLGTICSERCAEEAELLYNMRGVWGRYRRSKDIA